MLWSELTLSTGQWILPADRAKNDQELLLMLPPVMVKMLEERKKATGNWDHVWPGKFPKVIPEGYKSKPLNCFSQMLVQMQKRMEAIASKETGYEVTIPHWTIHDIRRSVSTGMNGLSDAEGIPLIPGDIVERVINHKILGVAGRYNRADYLLEKKRALQLWADHLASLVA
jgi:integrase